MSKPIKKKLISGISVVLTIALSIGIVVLFSNKSFDDDVILLRTKNGVDIRQSVYKIYLHSAAVDFRDEMISPMLNEDYDKLTTEEKKERAKKIEEVFITEVDGRKPIEIIKEDTLHRIKIYAYYAEQCKINKVDFTEEQLQGFKTVWYKQFEDYDFEELIGVTTDQYINYLVDVSRHEVYRQGEEPKIEVPDTMIGEKFDLMREEYADVTAKTVFLRGVTEENRIKIEEIKAEFVGGESMDRLIEKYSDFIGNSKGKWDVTKSSTENSSFGNEYKKSVLNSKVGETKILETSTGYIFYQTIKVDRTSFADSKLKELCQEEIFANKLVAIMVESGAKYEAYIVDENLYNSIQLPTDM